MKRLMAVRFLSTVLPPVSRYDILVTRSSTAVGTLSATGLLRKFTWNSFASTVTQRQMPCSARRCTVCWNSDDYTPYALAGTNLNDYNQKTHVVGMVVNRDDGYTKISHLPAANQNRTAKVLIIIRVTPACLYTLKVVMLDALSSFYPPYIRHKRKISQLVQWFRYLLLK